MSVSSEHSRTPDATAHLRSRTTRPLAILAVTIGLMMHVAGFAIFQVVAVPEDQAAEEDRFVLAYADAEAVRGQGVVREQALLFDTAPLFLPTRWNAAADLPRATVQGEIAPLFSAFPDQVALRASDSELLREAIEPLALSPLDLTRAPWVNDFGPWQEDGASPRLRLPERDGLLEVYRADGSAAGRTVLRLTDESLGQALRHFGPLGFYVTIVDGAVVGSPYLARPPEAPLGATALDAADYVAALRPLVRLRVATFGLGDGYYRVTVGP